jgi:hypothetical protein
VRIKLNITLTAALLFLISLGNAQQLNLFLNQEYAEYYTKALNNPYVPIHTGFKPLIESDINRYMSSDSIQGYIFNGPKRSLVHRKIYQESLFIIHDSSKKFWATIDPLFNFEGSDDRGDSSRKLYQNTRGFLIQGGIGNKFSFSTSFYEDQATFPYYVDNFIQARNTIPGEGGIKTLNPTVAGGSFYSNGYDFSVAESYLSFSPSQHFNFQIGEGKNFIGDGYRSLLLSDNSYDYPFFRLTTSFGRLQYTNLYCLLLNPNLTATADSTMQRKAASFQYLSWNIANRLEWGIFQGMIWQASDKYNRQHYNLFYVNPVIGVSALNYGFANNNYNILLGSTLKYKITKNFLAYGQLLVNDLGPSQSISNKMGYQAGLKFYNRFCQVMVEYNQVRPYTYMSTNSAENYTNYNQALADPLGANFKEFVASVNYRFAKHFALHLQVDYAVIGENGLNANYGSNILMSDTAQTKIFKTTASVSQNQGIKGLLNYADAHVSYLMNPRTNMNIVLGVTYRELSESTAGYNSPITMLFYVGFRTSIINSYFDF